MMPIEIRGLMAAEYVRSQGWKARWSYGFWSVGRKGWFKPTRLLDDRELISFAVSLGHKEDA